MLEIQCVFTFEVQWTFGSFGHKDVNKYDLCRYTVPSFKKRLFQIDYVAATAAGQDRTVRGFVVKIHIIVIFLNSLEMQ